ncbi:MAG: hypothetical protein GX878_01895, partial [Firmicutes bacterium]|nr:hypothetical protein [Bacillota bacterium]
VKSILAWYLTAVPALHVGGAALASVIGTGVAAVLNLYAVAHHTGWRFRIVELVLLPGFCVALMAAAVKLSYRLFFSLAEPLFSARLACSAAVFPAIVMGIAVYSVALLLTGSLTRDELELIPRIGLRLAELAGRWKLLNK